MRLRADCTIIPAEAVRIPATPCPAVGSIPLAKEVYNEAMRRPMLSAVSVAAFALFLAVPLWAQHGGGGHAGGGHGGGSFGGHAGFSGGGGSHFSGGASRGMSSGAVHSASGGSRSFSRPDYSQRAFSRPGRSSGPYLHNEFRGPRFRNGYGYGYGYRNCYGYNCPYIYPDYGGYYDPYWWGDSDSSSYDQDYQDDVAQAADMNRQSLEEQQMFRQEQADGDQDIYARPHSSNPLAGGAGAENEAQGASIIPATVLVFRDQHKQEIQNYAIIGQTLWSFGPPHTQKIPLADIDLPATIKTNDERGVSFHVPIPDAGQ